MNTTDPDARLFQLMEGVKSQNKASFNELSERVRGILFATIYKVLNNREDSEDVCQDVLIKVWERSHLFDRVKGRPLTWMRTLARNSAIDRLRSKKRRSDLNERYREDSLAASDQVTRDLADVVATLEYASVVRRAVIGLNPEQQQVLEMAYFGGLTRGEIAKRLDQPLGTVKARIRRGVKNLRDRVTPALEGCWK